MMLHFILMRMMRWELIWWCWSDVDDWFQFLIFISLTDCLTVWLSGFTRLNLIWSDQSNLTVPESESDSDLLILIHFYCGHRTKAEAADANVANDDVDDAAAADQPTDATGRGKLGSCSTVDSWQLTDSLFVAEFTCWSSRILDAWFAWDHRS